MALTLLSPHSAQSPWVPCIDQFLSTLHLDFPHYCRSKEKFNLFSIVSGLEIIVFGSVLALSLQTDIKDTRQLSFEHSQLPRQAIISHVDPISPFQSCFFSPILFRGLCSRHENVREPLLLNNIRQLRLTDLHHTVAPFYRPVCLFLSRTNKVATRSAYLQAVEPSISE